LQRLDILLSQIRKATEHCARVVIHGDFNLDLDRSDNSVYYIGAMLKSLSECTTSSGLETHYTSPTFRLFGSFRPQGGGDQPPPGDPLSPAGDSPSPSEDGPRSTGSVQSPAGDNVDYHKYSRLDHLYTKGFISELVVLTDSTTDHRPVVTTVRAGNHVPKAEKLVSLKRQNVMALTRSELEGALNLHDWLKVYNIKDVVDAFLKYLTVGIISALNIVAPKKEIRVKKRPNLYLARETLEMMKRRNTDTSKMYRNLRNKVTCLVRRDKQDSNLLSLKKVKNDPKVLWGLPNQALGKASVGTRRGWEPHHDPPGGRRGGEQVLRGQG
jgi:hypothetical protein